MATRDPTNPFGPSLLDIISSLSGAPLNLHMFSALPTSADGPATAASPADAGAQSPSPSSSPAPGDAQPPSMLGSVAAAGDGGLLARISHAIFAQLRRIDRGFTDIFQGRAGAWRLVDAN
jgi:hypothetical protein